MSEIDPRLSIGGNLPPVSEMIKDAYSPIKLALDHEALAAKTGALNDKAAALTAVSDETSNERAAALVIELRALSTEIDDTKETVKAPVLAAGRTVDAFFNALNISDTKRAGKITAHKIRLEKLTRDYAFEIAEKNRKLAAEAAQRERDRAAKEAEEAARLEALNKPVVADIVMTEAIKSEGFAERFESRASGPVQDLARTHTDSGVTGLRAVPGFEVDWDAVRKTLGPLGPYMKADAIEMAIRAFRQAQGKMDFAHDDQHAKRRELVSKPALVGVTFVVNYEGNVR